MYGKYVTEVKSGAGFPRRVGLNGRVIGDVGIIVSDGLNGRTVGDLCKVLMGATVKEASFRSYQVVKNYT